MKYIRILSYTEGSRSFIKIDSEHLKMFPPLLMPFTLIIGKNRGHVKLDKQHRIWLSKMKFVVNMQPNDKLEIVKNQDGTYSLYQIGTE